MRERTGDALDALEAKAADGTVVDVTADLAVPLPIQLIAQLLGLPPGDEERLFRWSEAAIPGATDWSEDERNALLGEMTVELLGLAAARRQEPRDDVVSMLADLRGGRRVAHRRRARHVPHPAARRRQRDHPQRHLGRARRPRRAP